MLCHDKIYSGLKTNYTSHLFFCCRPVTCFLLQTHHMLFFAADLSHIVVFCGRPFTCFFCCRPVTSLSSRMSSKGFKAPLARQGPGKLHVAGPCVVSFIIIRPHVIDGLGIVGAWPCFGEGQALF